MGNCSKVPRTNSNEEIKVNNVNRNQLLINSNNPSPAHPVHNQYNGAPPYPAIQNPQAYRGQPVPAYPASQGNRAVAQGPPPHAPNHFYIQSIPISGGRLQSGNPGITETKAVTRYCRIIDEKLNLIPADDNLHWVNFNYKCKFPAQATIHYFVREGFDRRDNRHFFYANPETFPKATTFILQAGDNQLFENCYKTAFSTVNKHLLEVSDKCTYPIVIEIECAVPSNPRDSQILINCYKITHEHHEYQATVLKQVIKIEGSYKILSNFYGTSVDADESECLICLTEKKRQETKQTYCVDK